MSEEQRVDRTDDGAVPEESTDRKSKKKGRDSRGVGYELYMLLHDLVYILAVVTLVFVFAIRLVGVDGDSMYPTLHNTDYLALLSNVFYGEPEQGDIVVMTVPYFENEPIVKRVIATEGQTVDIDFEQGIVYVDGEALDEPYINEPTYLNYDDMGQGLDYPVTVPEGCVFVMGDNRNHSADSRFAPVGMVDERDILGKVLFVLLPGADETTGSRDFGRIGSVS